MRRLRKLDAAIDELAATYDQVSIEVDELMERVDDIGRMAAEGVRLLSTTDDPDGN